MALATKHRSLPILIGASLAFAGLNVIAVLFGNAIANWLPEIAVTAGVALLFLLFGVQALRHLDQDTEIDDVSIKKSFWRIVLSTLMMIAMAEFGDKTQLSVVALSSSYHAGFVWLGATLALVCTSALGIWMGKALLQRINVVWLHRVSGVFFILLGLYAGMQAVELLTS